MWPRVTQWTLLALAACLLGSYASASEAELRQVHINLVGQVGRQPTLPERFTSWFDPTEYQISIERPDKLDTERILSPPPDGAVYVWVTVRNDAEARLYFASAQPNRAPLYSLREVALDSGLDELGAERLSQIVHLSCLALFEGQGEHQRAEVEQMLDRESPPSASVESPPPAPPPEPPRKETPPPRYDTANDEGRGDDVGFRLEGALGYGFSYRSDEGLWHGPRGGLSAWMGDRFLVHLGVQGFLPHDEDIAQVQLRFWGGSIDLGLGAFARWGNGFLVALSAGPGLDVVRYEPQSSLSEQVSIGTGELEVRPQVGLNLRWAVRGSALGAAVVVRAAYSLSRTHYDLQSDQGSRPIATPSRFLPTAVLELSF